MAYSDAALLHTATCNQYLLNYCLNFNIDLIFVVGAYSKKLDTLAQMTIERKTGVLCQDCGPDGEGDGRTTPKQTIALKYSHRNDM